jgi:hypothetical protein
MITVVKTVPSLPRSLSGFMGASVVTAAFTFPIEEGAFEGVDTSCQALVCVPAPFGTRLVLPPHQNPPRHQSVSVWQFGKCLCHANKCVFTGSDHSAALRPTVHLVCMQW